MEIIQGNLSKLRENRSRKISYIRNLRQHPEIYQPFLIIVTLSIIQQFSGMSILRTYVVKIFDQVFHTLPDGSEIRLLDFFLGTTEIILNNKIVMYYILKNLVFYLCVFKK